MSHSTFSIRCPHCKSKASTRTSREISPVYREIYLACGNVLCGHTYKASISVLSTLSPSAIPDPNVALPLANYTRAQALLGQAANDDNLPAANDDDGPVRIAPPVAPSPDLPEPAEAIV